MKKNIVLSYLEGLQAAHGQTYQKITAYFIPEFVTAIVLYSLPLLIDAFFIACLKSTESYATLGMTNSLLHFIVKVAEGLSVGTIVMTGILNGQKAYQKAGSVLINAFWTTVLVGSVITLSLFFGAPLIYWWYGLPPALVKLGIPFLQIRAVGVFFTFVYFAFIGFLRGIKNTQVPMMIFIAGCSLFLVCDYILIFGKCGFEPLHLTGSAVATVIQYVFMCVAAFFYVAFNPLMRQYGIKLFSHFANWHNVKQLFELSWPVMVDKGTMAWSYLWLGKCIAPMGTCVIASFAVIKDLERFAILPVIALAQVVTLLVSNDCGRHDWQGIKVTIKRIILLSSILTFAILFVCCLSPVTMIRFFDMKGEFTDFAAKLFPLISILTFFDILQLILASALRGAANVKIVMWTRLFVCCGLFAPVSYIFSTMNMTNQMLKFMLVYSSLYFANALMSIVYIRRLRGTAWIASALRNQK